MEKVRVGVVGCGAISVAYLRMAPSFPILEIAARAALSRAEEFAVPKAYSVEEMMADPEVDVVLNLTVPKAHVPIALEALRNGKHTFAEKPFGVDRAEGEKGLPAMQ